MGLVYNPLYLKIHTFTCLRKKKQNQLFFLRPPAIAFAFLESIDLAKKFQRGWGASPRMAVISTELGEKPINNFYNLEFYYLWLIYTVIL